MLSSLHVCAQHFWSRFLHVVQVSTDLFATRQAVTLLDWQTASTEAKPAVAADDTRLLRMGIQAEKLQVGGLCENECSESSPNIAWRSEALFP
jgi:hypothetical protein